MEPALALQRGVVESASSRRTAYAVHGPSRHTTPSTHASRSVSARARARARVRRLRGGNRRFVRFVLFIRFGPGRTQPYPEVIVLGTTIAALLLAASPAPASDPSALLDCWAKALGGRDRLAKVKSVEMEGKVTSPGENGTFHAWTRSDGAKYEEAKFGPVASRYGFDGQRAWAYQGFEPVHDVTGVEMEGETTWSYVGSFSALVPGRMPGEVRPGPTAGTVVLAPKGGRE